MPLENRDGKLSGYKIKTAPPIYIVGRYTTPCGGCDTLKGGAVETEQYVEYLSSKGHVVFEGLVISGITGRWVALARRLPECEFIFLELDTPIEKCIERVTARRNSRGNTTPFNPVNLIRKFKRVRQKLPETSGECWPRCPID